MIQAMGRIQGGTVSSAVSCSSLILNKDWLLLTFSCCLPRHMMVVSEQLNKECFQPTSSHLLSPASDMSALPAEIRTPEVYSSALQVVTSSSPHMLRMFTESRFWCCHLESPSIHESGLYSPGKISGVLELIIYYSFKEANFQFLRISSCLVNIIIFKT